MRKLNGWKRLWVAFCGVALLVSAVNLALEFPQSREIAHRNEFFESLAPEYQAHFSDSDAELTPEVRELIQMYCNVNKNTVSGDNGKKICLKASVDEATKIAIVQQYNEILHKEANSKGLKMTVAALFWWLILCIAIYGAGWTIAWIRRGFQADK